jgi:hypothetical protein
VTKVLANLEKTNIAMTPKALCEEEAWQTSVGNFIYNVEETATNYRDITVPFLTAVYQVNFSKLPVYCLVQVMKPIFFIPLIFYFNLNIIIFIYCFLNNDLKTLTKFNNKSYQQHYEVQI